MNQDVILHREKDSKITVAGVELHCTIFAEVECILSITEAQFMSGQMEMAEEGTQEVTIDSVCCYINIYAKDEDKGIVLELENNDVSFFEEHFGDLDPQDVMDSV